MILFFIENILCLDNINFTQTFNVDNVYANNVPDQISIKNYIKRVIIGEIGQTWSQQANYLNGT